MALTTKLLSKVANITLIVLMLIESNSIAFAKTSLHPILTPTIANIALQKDDADDCANRIDLLTRQIIIKEIELKKFNIHYKMEVGEKGRWSGWRYAAFQEGNYCANLAAGIAGAGERTSHLRTPDHLSPHKLGVANITSMIGYIIGAGSAALELAITEYHDHQASKLGFSPNMAMKHVLTLKNEIDGLLLERDALIKIEQAAPLLHDHAEIDTIEGKVLRDLSDLTLLEYERYHIKARRFVAFQKSLYLFDMTKYTIASVGAYFTYMAQHKHDRKWNLKAGIMYDISGALIIATPYASRGIGIIAEKLQKHLMHPVIAEVRTRELATLQTDEEILQKAYKVEINGAVSGSPQLKRMVVYHKESDNFHSSLLQALDQERAGKLTATQNMIAGTFTGGTHLANGILYTVVGDIASGNSRRDARVTNCNLAAGAITSLPGNTVAILDTLRIQVQAEILRHKYAKEGKLPQQLLKGRLTQLNQMEQQLNKP